MYIELISIADRHHGQFFDMCDNIIFEKILVFFNKFDGAAQPLYICIYMKSWSHSNILIILPSQVTANYKY